MELRYVDWDWRDPHGNSFRYHALVYANRNDPRTFRWASDVFPAVHLLTANTAQPNSTFTRSTAKLETVLPSPHNVLAPSQESPSGKCSQTQLIGKL